MRDPWPCIALLLVTTGCPGRADDGTASASSSASTTTSSGETSTGDPQTTAEPTGGPSSTTAIEPMCMCHDDCPVGRYCYPDGRCDIDPNDCGEAVAELPLVGPNLVLVLDKSSSMGALLWDGDGDPNTPDVTRWRSLHGAVEGLVTAYERSLSFGAVASPSTAATSEYTIAACPVAAVPEVPVAPMNAATLLAGLPPASAGAPTLAGATPTRAALNTAIMHLEAQMDGRPRAIVLVTDGAANCSLEAIDDVGRFEVYDEAVVQVVADAAAAGITTFVVGLAVADAPSNSEPDGEPDATNLFDRLNQLAIAGGAPQDDPDQRFFAASDQPGIEAALTTIAAALLPCVVQLDPIPPHPDFVEVRVGDVDHGGAADVDDCAGIDGWRHVDAEAGTIELCGQACADYRTTGLLEVKYLCVPPSEPPQCPSSPTGP